MGKISSHSKLACSAFVIGSLLCGPIEGACAQAVETPALVIGGGVIGTLPVAPAPVIIGKVASVKDWQTIQGSASDLAVGSDGSVAAVDRVGNVYRYNHTEDSWQPIGSQISRLAIDKEGTIWGVDQRGVVRQFTGTSWNAVGAGASDIAISKDGIVYVTTNTSNLASYDPKTRAWQAIEGTGERLALDLTGMIWIVSKEGKISRRLDDIWIEVPGKARDITTGDKGNVYITATDGKLLRWNDKAISWTQVNGADNSKVLAAGDGQLWYANPNGGIFAKGITDRHRHKDDGINIGESGKGGKDPQEVADTSTITFEELPSTQRLVELAIGKDGSVYGLTSGGDIKRWSNREKNFNSFPGSLEQIDVQNNGLPMGIGTADNLVKHDGEAWRQTYLNVKLNGFSLYDESKVLSLTYQDRVARLTDNLRSYMQLIGSGNKIVAKKDGSFWKLDSSNRIFSCDFAGNCVRKPLKAADIDVGPAGSVFIVDESNNLHRYNPRTDQFDVIRKKGDVARIALGPKDRPWFISTKGLVYYSQYFERDESQDRRLAIKSEATEDVTETDSGTSSSGVQIVETISFNTVTIPTTTSSYGSIGSGIRDITSGEDDVVIATGYDNPCSKGTGRNWIYNSLTSSFSYMDYLNRADIMVGLAAQQVANYSGEVIGETPPTSVTPNIDAFFGIWPNNCTTPELLEYVSAEFNSSTNQTNNTYGDAVLFTPNTVGTTSDLDIAKDGRLAFINTKNELKYFYPQSSVSNTVLTSKNFLRVGLGADINDMWVIDTSNNVYEYIPSSKSFELRSILDDDKAQDVGVGFDGTVYIVNQSGTLKKWSEISGKFIKTNKTGVTRVAVDSRGRPIVGNFPDSQIVYFGR